jgi:hypothetical protein
MNKTLTTLLAATATCFGLAAHAADVGATASTDAPTLNRDEAKQLKTQSDADYKARKKVADANKALDKADCKNTFDGGVERACKSDARATAKEAKAEAKVIHEAEKADIKANSK